jgi:hypothetical protein
MSPEQIAALITTIIGAPLLIEIVKRWFESRNITLQTDSEQDKVRDEREWAALNAALERERQIYSEFINQQKSEFSNRLASVEAQLATIQNEASKYQKLYWEERLQRERLQARVEYLEYQLQVVGKIGQHGSDTG